MTIREIRVFGDPVLKTKSDLIVNFDRAVADLIFDLEETTRLPGRAGVAAPQIGVNLRAFSYQVDGEVGHLINPEIIEFLGEATEVDEGCLSLPGIWSKTPRFPKVRVIGQKSDGSKVDFIAGGLLAQVMQHEVDHLDGLLYIDRLEPAARKIAMTQIRQAAWF